MLIAFARMPMVVDWVISLEPGALNLKSPDLECQTNDEEKQAFVFANKSYENEVNSQNLLPRDLYLL